MDGARPTPPTRQRWQNLAPRPMETVLAGTGGCTAYDVVLILKRGRHDVRGCSVKLTSERADTDPKVFTKIHMQFTVTGRGIPAAAVERAIAMSHEKLFRQHHAGQTAEITTGFDLVERPEVAAGGRPPPGAPLRCGAPWSSSPWLQNASSPEPLWAGQGTAVCSLLGMPFLVLFHAFQPLRGWRHLPSAVSGRVAAGVLKPGLRFHHKAQAGRSLPGGHKSPGQMPWKTRGVEQARAGAQRMQSLVGPGQVVCFFSGLPEANAVSNARLWWPGPARCQRLGATSPHGSPHQGSRLRRARRSTRLSAFTLGW